MKISMVMTRIWVLAAVVLLCTCLAAHAGDMRQGGTINKAEAVLYPTKDNKVMGLVSFLQKSDGVHVTADVMGLTPGKHGFHIHEYGDCSAPDGTSAGGHFSPERKQHGAPTAQNRHVGDLGNITAGTDGTAHLEWIDKQLSFSGPHSILGRAVIVHAHEDDHTSQPTGNAGPRVACGVIGIAKGR